VADTDEHHDENEDAEHETDAETETQVDCRARLRRRRRDEREADRLAVLADALLVERARLAVGEEIRLRTVGGVVAMPRFVRIERTCDRRTQNVVTINARTNKCTRYVP
jgi:hypothetical protein